MVSWPASKILLNYHVGFAQTILEYLFKKVERFVLTRDKWGNNWYTSLIVAPVGTWITYLVSSHHPSNFFPITDPLKCIFARRKAWDRKNWAEMSSPHQHNFSHFEILPTISETNRLLTSNTWSVFLFITYNFAVHMEIWGSSSCWQNNSKLSYLLRILNSVFWNSFFFAICYRMRRSLILLNVM